MKITKINAFKASTASLAIGLACLSAPAFAQDTTETEDGATDAEIVVTGSLIRNPNLESSSPVNAIGEDEVQLRQTNTAEQILRELPGVTPNLGSNVNNGTAGVARVDLRNLGSNRNIVLLDGQRLTPSSFQGSVDLNNIPLALVERVDVLTGGASTTYGADAVSGVVNFITRRDFAGMDFTVSQQITERGDTNVFRADLTLGANFDDGRGNVVLALGYQEADPLYFGDRDSGTHTISSNNCTLSPATPIGGCGFAGGDSPTSAPAAFDPPGPVGLVQISPDGNSLIPAYAPYNFNPFNIYSTPFRRFNFFGKAHYDVSDTVTVYARGLFSKNTVRSIIASSGVFGNALTVPGNNPYLPATLRDYFCNASGIALGPTCNNNPAIPLGAVYRRSVELGPRISTYQTTVYDFNAGMRLNLTDSLSFDIYGSYGESENAETRSGYVANSRLQQALNATNVTTCTVTTNGCVPLNLFGPAGTITEAMGNFIGGITSTIVNAASLAQVHGVLSGDLGTLPWADEPIAFAVGGEYRNYTAARRPDSLASIPGELGGAGGAVLPLTGGYKAKEAFGELIIPVWTGLTLEAGIRSSWYTVDAAGSPKFDATTYKFGANFEPIDGVKFRANYQRAVRAPNIGELFAPVASGLTNLNADPCTGAAPVGNANLTAICIAQGASAGQIGSIPAPAANQVVSTGGGNPNILPEKATTYTFGLVLEPKDFVPGLTFTIDYYNILVKDAITNATPNDVIGACFGTITAASATSAACTSIRRNALTGGLSGTPTLTNPFTGLPTPLTNNGRLKTDGVDVTLNYRRDLGFADLGLSFSGNYALSSEFQAAPSSYNRDCVGYYSANCASPLPKFSWTQRTTLGFEDVDLSLLWRHIGSLKYEGSADDFLLRGFTATNRTLFSGTIRGGGNLVGNTYDFNRIKAYDYFDFTTRWSATENFTFTFTVFNIFDKKPPIVGSSAGTTTYNGGNTFPSSYDTIGRRFAVSGNIKF